MIVNADDFGASEAVNRATLEAIACGVVSTASIMATSAWFEDGCFAARDAGVAHRVGVHLVLDEGEPLTERIRRCEALCDSSGRFRRWRFTGRLKLTSNERQAAFEELRAQIARCRSLGIQVNHLDSHHHCHVEPAVLPIVAMLARECGVPVRIARNVGPRSRHAVHWYKRAVNAALAYSGLARSRFFGLPHDYIYLGSALSLENAEVSVHPVLDGAGRIVDASDLRPLNECIRELTAVAAVE